MLAALLMCLAQAPPDPTPAPPPPPVVVEIPPPPSPWVEIAVPVAARVKLVTTDNKPATWVLIDDAASLDELTGAAHFFAPAEGRYRVVAYQPDRGFTRLVMVAGKPKPGPDVIPPGPPGPPAPPTPADPLVRKLTDAVAANTEADKAETLKDMVAVFRVATRFARDANVTSTSDLIARVGKTVEAMVGAGKLKGVRAIIADDLEQLFPDTGADLTQEVRDKVVARFALYILALGQ